MADSANVHALKERCETIAAFFGQDSRSMVERAEWGPAGFNAGAASMDILFAFAKLVLKIPVELIPDEAVVEAATSLSSAESVLGQINAFDADRNTGADRERLIFDLNVYLRRALAALGPWLATMDALTGEYRTWRVEARGALDDLQQQARAFESYAAKKHGDIDAALASAQAASANARDAAQAASASVGATPFTKDFLAEAKGRRAQATKWLWGAASFATLALIMAASIVLGWGFAAWEADWKGASHLIGRVMGFSVLLYGTVWCSRIALANLHQETVNKHRANSILTLQAFRNAVSDPEVKDAVVLEAARATFENVPPGFVSKGTEQGAGPVRVLDSLVGRTAPKG